MKRWRVVVKRKAEEDIDEIWHLIADNNPRAAETFLDAIEEASTLLAATPEIGSPRYFSHPELQGLRFLPLRRFENYLLFYRAVENEEVVEIVRIVHGARDLPGLFAGKRS
jgi:toxin ParE1/3/4